MRFVQHPQHEELLLDFPVGEDVGSILDVVLEFPFCDARSTLRHNQQKHAPKDANRTDNVGVLRHNERRLIKSSFYHRQYSIRPNSGLFPQKITQLALAVPFFEDHKSVITITSIVFY
jgi:hypothetical protein